MEVVVLDDDPPARAEQQAARPVAAHPAAADLDVGIPFVGRHDVFRSGPVGQRLGEGHLGIDAVEPAHRLHRPAGIGGHRAVVHQFDLHPLAEEIDAVLSRVAPAQQGTVGSLDPLDGHVEAVDVRRVVLLVLEHAVDHADVAAAIDIVRGIGRDADHAVLAGSRRDDHPLERDVAAALRDDPHAAAVVQRHVAERHAARIGDREAGVQTGRGAEDHHVADRSLQVRTVDPPIPVPAPAGRDRSACNPVIVGPEGRFAPHGIEFEQVRVGVIRSPLVVEMQAPIDLLATVLPGEGDLKPPVARSPDNSLGVKRACVVDLQVMDLDPLALLDAER